MQQNYSGIPVKELQGYNPVYNQWATAPEKHQQLLFRFVEKFNKEVAANKGKSTVGARYKVQSGDSISVLASNTTPPAK
ncbi:hypothetical protein O9992_04375 [Vibrio lentus]|nr:hypothetical protein [Vibrio lentus]